MGKKDKPLSSQASDLLKVLKRLQNDCKLGRTISINKILKEANIKSCSMICTHIRTDLKLLTRRKGKGNRYQWTATNPTISMAKSIITYNKGENNRVYNLNKDIVKKKSKLSIKVLVTTAIEEVLRCSNNFSKIKKISDKLVKDVIEYKSKDDDIKKQLKIQSSILKRLHK